MLAALLPTKNGIILEGTKSPGTKLLMSGGGRCNITHDGPVKELAASYNTSGGSIRGALNRHSNIELCSWLEACGMPLVTEADGRIFPASGKASDVLDLLLSKARDNGWSILTEEKVRRIKTDARPYCVATEDKEFLCRNLIIASGGTTYPHTGSDGSMFKIMKRDLGLEIADPKSALAPLTVRDYPYSELAGVSLNDVEVRTGESRKAPRSRGALLFAHNELTGPAILNISRHVEAGSKISINYIPEVDNPLGLLVDAFGKSRAGYDTIVAECFGLPKRFAACIVERAKEKATATRDGISLKNIVETLSADSFTVESRSPRGMVSAGGVLLAEVDSKSFELVKHPGIYVIGEALDVDGITGGYNLQFAYSSAASAAASFLSAAST
ncbi:MAG: aminoacetone oxidase family FAD-binding enzyme [Mogibacterium sp.]|nr:aminoacetone oxidase family FAD-binding enzyme [Mogibacterium sp.]